jgi:hypothetical protein
MPSLTIGELMYNKRVTLWLGLTAGALVLAAQPAHANNFGNTKNLPDGSQIEHSRLQVDIVDKSPIVRDTRRPAEDTEYQINIPPMPAGRHTVVQVGDPAAAGGGGPVSIPIRRNGLPDAAGFNSNIPARPAVSTGPLPNGTTTNRLAKLSGEMVTKTKQTPGTAKPAPSIVAPTPTKVYDTTPSVSSADSHHSVSSVSGEVKHGSMLK